MLVVDEVGDLNMAGKNVLPFYIILIEDLPLLSRTIVYHYVSPPCGFAIIYWSTTKLSVELIDLLRSAVETLTSLLIISAILLL